MAAGPPNLQDVASRQGMQVKNGGVTLAKNGWIRGGQTGYLLGSGFFLGYSGGIAKMSIGNQATGNYLSWDGTNLTVAGTITLASVPWSSVTGAGKPADNADVTLSAVNGGLTVTGGGITLSAGGAIKGGQTAYNTGTGFFLGYSGTAYKFSIGSSTNSLTWDGSTLGVVGSITGASTINITGGAKFSGAGTSTSFGGAAAAVVANDSYGSLRAIIGVSNSTAQAIVGTNSNADGVGVYAENTGTNGIALQIAGHTVSNGIIKTGIYTVAGLPAAGLITGARAAVNDALGPAFGAIVVGGGTVAMPVFSDGVNWRCG